MNMRDRVYGVAALAVLAAAWTVAVDAQRGPASDGLILGQVVDATTGRPVAQATVSLGGLRTPPTAGGAPSAPARILTGSDGRFVFRDLPPGSYTVATEKAGYLPGAAGRHTPAGASRPIVIAAGARVGGVVIRMWKTATIAGMVQDESGEALVAVQVGAFRRTTVGGRPQLTRAGETMTDDRGHYRFGNLPPGDYLVATTMVPIAMPAPLVRTYTRSGFPPGIIIGNFVVMFGSGSPVPPPPSGDRLYVYPQLFYPGVESPTNALTITLASGHERRGIDLQLRPSAASAVRGRIVGPGTEGSPVLQLVRAETLEYVPGLPGGITAADERGEFLFPTVTEGSYVLRVVSRMDGRNHLVFGEAGTMMWTHVPVAVAGESVSDVTVVLREGLTVRGRVEFSGMRPPTGPLPPIPVAIEPAYGTPAVSSSGSTESFPARTTASGTFATLPNLPGGTYIVRVTNSPAGWMFRGAMYGGRDISTTGVEMSTNIDGVVLEFTDRWTGLQGTVRGGRAQPDSEATVLVFPYDPADWTAYGPTPRRLRTVRTSTAGTYTVDPLPAGDYYAIALHEEPPDWRDPSMLETLSRSATRVTVRTDGKTTQDLGIRQD
jgi:hypothetical protein